MSKAVFTTRVDPFYEDLPEFRYHFPRTYLNTVRRALGDWIVYYEPGRVDSVGERRGGRQAYFATARLDRIEPHPSIPDHFFAFVSNYLEFDNAVPFREGQIFFESALKRPDGDTNRGAFGRAVRTMPDGEYDLIVQRGFGALIGQTEHAANYDAPGEFQLADEAAEFERPFVEQLVKRPFRDAAFARGVKTAYEETCAVTGLKIINGGGRAEVQAAHIRPVADQGPDSVRNGVALCGTVHWMFDRGLLSVDDDYTILMARDRIPDTVGRMINPDGRLRLPTISALRPHPQFLEYHRNNIFKG